MTTDADRKQASLIVEDSMNRASESALEDAIVSALAAARKAQDETIRLLRAEVRAWRTLRVYEGSEAPDPRTIAWRDAEAEVGQARSATDAAGAMGEQE